MIVVEMKCSSSSFCLALGVRLVFQLLSVESEVYVDVRLVDAAWSGAVRAPL